MKINEIATGLALNAQGIWVSNEKEDTSYPEFGHSICRDIEPTSFWYSHRNNCVKKAIELFNLKEPFFDIGGGNGTLSKNLNLLGLYTILLEPAMEGAINAKNSGVKDVICSTFTSAGFKDNTIPSAGLFDVLEHIESDTDFLLKLNNALVPQGRLLITVPAYNFLWSANDEHVGHYRRYTLTTLSKKLIECGFAIDYSTYLFAPMPLPVLLIRTAPYRVGLVKRITKERTTRELDPKKNLLITGLNKVLGLETYYINRLKTIPFGSTCLIVATKK